MGGVPTDEHCERGPSYARGVPPRAGLAYRDVGPNWPNAGVPRAMAERAIQVLLVGADEAANRRMCDLLARSAGRRYAVDCVPTFEEEYPDE